MSGEHFSIPVGQEYNPCTLPEGATLFQAQLQKKELIQIKKESP